MNLRGWGFVHRGNLVGREGVEPSTKRLRVGRSRGQYQRNYRLLPLSRSDEKTGNMPLSGAVLRDLGRHGSLHLIEVLYRGKRVLRYVKDTDSVTPVMALESTTGGNTPVSEERAGQQAPN